jgi:hypothetical protein
VCKFDEVRARGDALDAGLGGSEVGKADHSFLFVSAVLNGTGQHHRCIPHHLECRAIFGGSLGNSSLG